MIKGMFTIFFRCASSGARGIGLALALSASICAATAWAQPAAHNPASGIAVIYPDVGEPYRSVFAQIVGGIEEKARGRVYSFLVGTTPNAPELRDAMRRQNAGVVIALGRQGIMAAAALGGGIGVVAGGILTATESEVRDMQVNILTPAPSLLFSRLKEMMPAARRVFVVYDPRQNAWLIRLAKEAARARGMELEAYEAQDLRSAMRAYQEIFAAADHRRDALWLPQDSTTVEESVVLPLVLQESWARSLAVFSSSYGHVKRGTLFSMYPDNTELGRSLAVSALEMLAGGGDAGMTALREAQIAINLRTAKHLGVDADRMQDVDMTFPAR